MCHTLRLTAILTAYAVDEPLSANFPLSTGQVDVMVPEVPTGSVYLVGSE